MAAKCSRSPKGTSFGASISVKLPSNASKAKSGTRADFEHQAAKFEAAAQAMLARHRAADTTDEAPPDPPGGPSSTRHTREAERVARLEHDAAQPGYFNLHGKGFRYRMRPVVTSTGAIRLEDAKAGAVWLQLANKSMLMDQKKGRRVADECANSEQLAYAENMKTNPPPKLFDTTGMGR